MSRSPKPRFALAWIGISLTLAGGCTRTDPFAAETAALKTLTDDYKLEKHKKDPDGHVSDLILEGARFDDGALALAGVFSQMQGLSLQGSTVTDAGLEKLPAIKTLIRMNIIAKGITDRGLLALRKQPSLQDVWLVINDKLTDDGMASLKKANPGVRLHVMGRTKPKVAKQP
jgi:hypothetical protein